MVDVRLQVDGDAMARVSIRDHGRGVDEAMLAEMFKPFWRAPGGVRRRRARPRDHRSDRPDERRAQTANARDGGLVVTIEVPLAR